jgi:hypothetical protein
MAGEGHARVKEGRHEAGLRPLEASSTTLSAHRAERRFELKTCGRWPRVLAFAEM